MSIQGLDVKMILISQDIRISYVELEHFISENSGFEEGRLRVLSPYNKDSVHKSGF